MAELKYNEKSQSWDYYGKFPPETDVWRMVALSDEFISWKSGSKYEDWISACTDNQDFLDILRDRLGFTSRFELLKSAADFQSRKPEEEGEEE